MEIRNWDDFEAHIMNGLHCTLEGLENLYAEGAISAEEFVQLARQARQAAKVRLEDFKQKIKLRKIMKRFFFGLLGALTVMLLMGACQRGQFVSYFQTLGEQVPLQEVRYTLAQPRTDTVLVWASPYGVFLNQTRFVGDSIYHRERFDWRALGNFLYDQYETRRKRRARARARDTLKQGCTDMQIIKDFYAATAERLRAQVVAVAHIDEFRGQLGRLGDEYPLDCPALLLQILPMQWGDYGRGEQRAEATMRVHIVQHNYTTLLESSEAAQHLDRHALGEQVYRALAGWGGDRWTRLRRAASALDENPSDLIADTVDFSFTLYDRGDGEAEDARYQYVNPDLIARRNGIA